MRVCDRLALFGNLVAFCCAAWVSGSQAQTDTPPSIALALSVLNNPASKISDLESALLVLHNDLNTYTFEKRRAKWGQINMNIGFVSQQIADRLESLAQDPTPRLLEAREAYQACLKVVSPQDGLELWAETQEFLAAIEGRLGDRETETGKQKEAVNALRMTLVEVKRGARSREEQSYSKLRADNGVAPLETEISVALASALNRLASREKGTAELEEAHALLRDVLSQMSPTSTPRDWRQAERQLGLAFAQLGARRPGGPELKEAVDAFRSALMATPRAKAPTDWAGIQYSLGNALLLIGQRDKDAKALHQAIEAYQAALTVQTIDTEPYWRARTLTVLNSAQKLAATIAPMRGKDKSFR
jgi:tetratricopeptide (TPR) repeat protein